MRNLAILGTVALAVTPVAAHAAQATQSACVTPGEFSALAGYALPSVISGTTQRCSAALGANSFLPRNGRELAARYAERKAESWPTAKAVFLKMGNANSETGKMMQGLPDNTLQTMVDAVMEGMISQEIPLDKCDTIDRFARLLAPLPPANTADLIALAVELAGKGQGKVGKIQLCPSA
jgi:Alphavirus glycoprotein J